ncbi:MAG: hypothetical protein HN849_27330 [Victivallales bacterium]|jgi:hypothetical protein|nr:hypothetical protein [Victivallales bacterium]MBT7303272.1 hypothetical protein [Victivallales bacterium]
MKRLPLLSAVAMTGLVLNGCAILSNTRIRDGDSEKHMVSVVGIPLWMSTKPVQKKCCGNTQ